MLLSQIPSHHLQIEVIKDYGVFAVDFMVEELQWHRWISKT